MTACSTAPAMTSVGDEVVRVGLDAWQRAAVALKRIRDARLYRCCFRSFDEYVLSEHGLKRQRAYELIEAASVAVQMSETSDTPIERESHAIAALCTAKFCVSEKSASWTWRQNRKQ